LLRHVHREIGYAWLSAATLAKTLKLARVTVERALPVLERCGYFKGKHRDGKTTLFSPVDELPTAPPTSIKMSEVTSRKMREAPPSKRTKNLRQNEGESLREISLKNLSEAPPPPSAAAEAQQSKRAADEERKTIDLTATPRDEGLARALAGFAACKPSGRTITADQVATVITSKPIPPTSIDVTPVAGDQVTIAPTAERDTWKHKLTKWGEPEATVDELMTRGVAIAGEKGFDHLVATVPEKHSSQEKLASIYRRLNAIEIKDRQPTLWQFVGECPAPAIVDTVPAGECPAPAIVDIGIRGCPSGVWRTWMALLRQWGNSEAGARALLSEWIEIASAKVIGTFFEKQAVSHRPNAEKTPWIAGQIATLKAAGARAGNNSTPMMVVGRQAEGSPA